MTDDIYKKLAIIPIHDPTASVPAAKEGDNAGEQTLHVCYKVWKPRPDFKKSAPGEPDFRVAVLDARDGGVPDIEQLDRLLLSTPYAPPDPTKQLYQKLKHGYRHVVLAVVDTGVVSYMRIADAGFGKEKVYERGSRGRGNKGGRGRGGRQNRGGIR
jgi:tRNA-splicing endonuclease subunit Sen54